MTFNIHFVFILLYISGSIAQLHWGYGKNVQNALDPDHWYEVYKSCNGARQSPIDIELPNVIYNPELKPIMYENHDKRIPLVEISNNGHTVLAMIPAETNPIRLVSESFNTTYRLKAFHFHWGHDDSYGSEHVLLNKHYPLEMHLVHVDENAKDEEEALSESYGLLVLAVFFDFGRPTGEMILMVLVNDTVVRNLLLKNILPQNWSNYLQYSGSLTTPPCNEAVKWVILTNTAHISKEQISIFRQLKRHINVNGEDIEESMDDNDRTIQDVKERKIYLYYNFDNLG